MSNIWMVKKKTFVRNWHDIFLSVEPFLFFFLPGLGRPLFWYLLVPSFRLVYEIYVYITLNYLTCCCTPLGMGPRAGAT